MAPLPLLIHTVTVNSSSRKPPAADFDALIIGGGHNGLTCACYLARAGLRVAVFERRGIVGGAAVTEEFHPGFRNSAASYTVSLLDAGVIAELGLAGHGLRVVERPMQNFLPLPDGDSFSAGPTTADTIEEVRRFSVRDAARLPAFNEMLGRAVALLRDLLHRTPPTDLRRGRDLWEALRFGHGLRALPLTAQRELHELFTRSAGEILDHWFESDALKALYGFDAIVGNYASPYTPGSAYVLLHHAFGEVNGKSGIWGHAIGGMGAITQAMAAEARRLGEMVEHVMQYSGLESGRGLATQAPLAPAALVDEAIAEATPVVAAAGVRIERVVADELPAVLGDAAALRSAVQNLVANAVKYGGDDRWVGIRVEGAGDGRKREVRITVEDHGGGVPAEDLPHIFEPFYRGAEAIGRQVHGNGLGLSIVKRIVSAHGGTISVSTRAGEGSAFTIALPAADSPLSHWQPTVSS